MDKELYKKRETVINNLSTEDMDMYMTLPFFRTSLESLLRGGNEVNIIKELCLIIKSQQAKIQLLSDTSRESKILDKNGVQVKIGDTLIFPYVTPLGTVTEEEDFRAEVLFKYGCFGYENERAFIPLIEWMVKEKGEYISNVGNKIIYTEKYLFWVQ